MMRIWFDGEAIVRDAIPPLPARSMLAVVAGDIVHVVGSSGYKIIALDFHELADKDGNGFASAAAAKAYLDVEFAKYASLPPHTHPIFDVTGLQNALDSLTAADANNAAAITTVNTNTTANAAAIAATNGVVAGHATAIAGLQTALNGKLGNAITPSTPTRALNTDFTPSATKPVLCTYSVRTQVTNPLLIGTSTATCRLLSDTATTPTTERGRVEASSGVGVTVTIALTTSNTATLTYLCPPGHKVRLASSTTGTGTVTIASQTEVAIG